MDAWHIISVGDEAYLFKIMQFLAMLSSPGTSLYAKLGMLGALIGIILLALQMISTNAKSMNFGALAVGIIGFVLLFGQTTRVVIEDYHTGRTDVVDGVPLGTAIVGYVVSQGGVGISELFQAGTAVPGHETLAPDFALTALAATRALTDGDLCSGGNTAACAFSGSANAYVRDCVIPKRNGMGQSGSSWWSGDPRQASDALSSMEVDSDFLTTSSLITPAGVGVEETVSCKQAYNLLQGARSRPDITDAIASVLLAAAHQSPAATSPGAATAQAQEVIQNMFASLGDGQASSTTPGGVMGNLSASATDAQNMMMNAVIAHAMTTATIRGHATPSDVSNSAIVESAAQRRNVSFAAEQSMFARTLNATMTFFEGVIYGLAPFVAFLIPMGGLGAKFFGRYLQLLLWIFLWMPLMSFVNLFEVMSVLRQMNALAPSRGMGQLTSMVGILQAQYTVGDWIAMGGWLSASVVGLAGMIVFGSVAAFQSIAGAAHGPDAVDPSSLAPETISSAPMMQMGGVMANSAGEGTFRRGAAYHSFDVGATAQSSLRHSEEWMKAQSASLSAALAHNTSAEHRLAQAEGIGTSVAHGTSASATEGMRTSRTSSDSASGSQSFNASNRSGDSKRSTLSETNSLTLQDQVSASVGIKTPLGGVSGGVSSTVANQKASQDSSDTYQSHDTASGRSMEKGNTEGAQSSKDMASQLSNDTLERLSHDTSFATSMGYSKSEAESIQRQASSLMQARESYSTEQSVATSVGMHQQMSEQTYAQNVASNQAVYGETLASAQSLNGERFHELVDQFSAEGRYADQRQTMAAAAGVALYEASVGGGSDMVRSSANEAFMKSSGFGGFGGMGGGPSLGGMADMRSEVGGAVARDEASVSRASSLGGVAPPQGITTGGQIREKGREVDASGPADAQAVQDAYVEQRAMENRETIQRDNLRGMHNSPMKPSQRSLDRDGH